MSNYTARSILMCLAGSVCRRYMASIRASESVPSYGSPLSLQHDGPVTKPWSRALDHLTLRHFCSERKHVSSTGLATLDKQLWIKHLSRQLVGTQPQQTNLLPNHLGVLVPNTISSYRGHSKRESTNLTP